MEVKPGYKLTDVGVIPEEWEVKRLGELGSVVRGGSPRPAGDSRYFNGDFTPWLTVAALTNIPDHQLRVTETAGFLTEEGSKRSRTLANGTVIIANSGATLGVAKLLGMTCCANDGIAAIINQRSGDKAFVCHYINTRTKHLREVVATGNGQPNLNTALIRQIPIPFPTVPEQRAIADALSDIDALLGALDQLIAKKRDLKQAAMQQLLTGRTRLRGFSGEWEVKRLNELADIRSGGTPSTVEPHFWDGDVPWCTPTDITALGGHKYLSETSRTITHHGLKASSAEIIPADSIVMTSRATIGECAINTIPVSTNQGFKNFIPFATTDVNFLYYLLMTQKQGFISLCGGSTFLEIGKTQLATYQVRLPSLKAEQTAIATVLSDMDAELSALVARRDKTRVLKQAMMQELLTGKTRLVPSKVAHA
ncbi:restriction endonuclease subunit S [Variovorax sp. LjRoot178]|uniref:restriction endonuclease subunit S n=1 Tax=Variovorax sp. LjRoot178 TaxID=3342277 RepID=UPI003ECC3176